MDNKNKLVLNESENSDEISHKIISEYEEEQDFDSQESSEDNCQNIISEFIRIKKCSILKYGISLSTEKIKFGNCHTCDTNLMYPICSDCLIQCHKRKGHDIREIEEPDFIICGCGERMHRFKENEKKKNKKCSSECPYTDWCEKSMLSTLYIIGEKCICEFCYRMCEYEGKARTLEKEREMLQVCECESLNGNITHMDLKKIYHKLEEIIDKDHNLILGIEPIKFLNLLFLGKSSYESVFQNFQEMIQNINSLNSNNKLTLKDNFSSTNFFLSLNVFTKITNKVKGNQMRYFDKEISKKISFNLISNLLKYINYYDNKIFWLFLNGMLYLFRKVNVGLKTMAMSKYKLSDLENFSPFQRLNIFMFNNSVYPEAQNQIDFFIKYLNNLLNEDIQLPEACDVIIQICAILKRLSGFYLFTGFEMTSFCFTLDNLFQYLKNLKSFHKKIKLYNIIMKMLNYFIYSYNDNSFLNFVLENKKEDLSKVKFVFDKNELGRLISRNTIRMLYYTICVKKLNKLIPKDYRCCENIIEHGTKIFNLMLTERDNYFMNSMNAKLDIELFFKTLEIPEEDEKYIKIREEANNIEKCFSSFYSFDLDNKEVIRSVNDSLEKVLLLAKAGESHPHISKANFFFTLMKTLYICDLEEKEEENIEDVDLIKNFMSNVLLFLHYFMDKNSGNALLVCSHYVVNSLLKLPDIYINEIFRIYIKCSDIISKKRGFICNIKYIVKNLYKYIIKFKNNSKEKADKEAQDFFMDGVTILDQVIFFYLNIVIKLYLQTKLIYPYRCREQLKKIILEFLNVFNFQELMPHNASLILLLINRVFSSSDQNDREKLKKLIPIQKLVLTLEYTSIELDYRTQILIFLKLFKCSLYFKKVEIPSVNSNQTRRDVSEIGMKTLMGEGIITKARSKLKKIKKLHHLNKEKIYEIDVHLLFKLNDEIIQKNNNYLNAIGQNGDIFQYIKNNPLISNYKYPTKYLSFYYFFIKNEDIKHSFKIAEASIDLYQKELKRFKDIFEKNTNYSNKMFRYLIKGIILPLCPILKILFCYTAHCNGYNILMLYQTIMKMLYIKNYIIDMSNSFLSEKKFAQYEHFDINGFMDKKLQEENLEDYFILKNKIKCSPYDFTYIWDIFEKHFLSYIKYPDSMNLLNNYPQKKFELLTCGQLSEDTDLLDSLNFTLRKKGNSLKRKGIISRTKSNNFLFSTIDPEKKFIASKKSAFSANRSYLSGTSHQLTSPNLIEDEKGGEQAKITMQKITKIYDYYIKQKLEIDKSKSSFVISLAELCPEYEINFRKMTLTIITNIPGEEIEYSLIARLILYKLIVMSTEDTQNDIISLIGKKEKDDIGFISNLCNLLYDNILKMFIDDFNLDFVTFKATQIEIYSINKILKYLCEEHNNYFQQIILCNLEYSFTKFSECKMTSTHKSSISSRNSSKTSNESDTEETMSFFNFLVNALDKILIITQNVHNKRHIGFLFDIVYSIIELLVEIIQGNKKEILSKSKEDEIKNNMSLFSLQNFVSIVSDILLDDSLIEGHAFRTRLLLISFFIAILEEKTNEEVQKIIMKFLSINKVMASIGFTMKNYFYKITKDDPQYKEYYSNYNEKQIYHKEFIFDHTVYSFFKYHYFHSEISKESKEFELANNYYKYIKKLSINEKSPEAEDLVKQIDNLTEKEAKKKFLIFNKKIIKSNKIVPVNLINEKEKSISITYIEHYYIVKFFEYITKVVEIRLPHERRNVNVIFTIPCEMIHLSEMTKEEFVYNVDRNSENSKKFELIRSISLFQLEIEYFKNTNVNCFSKFILSIDYIYVQFGMYIFALIFLIFMLFTLEGYKGIEPIIEEGEIRRVLRNLLHIPPKIINSINYSIDSWGHIYNYICYIFCGLNAILIFSWIVVKMPLYYIMDKFKYVEENKIKESQLTFWNRASIMIFSTIIGRDYITTLLYMFIISGIGTILIRGEIVYAFLLLAILDLNQTLKGIAISIKLRGPELGASFLLLIFIVYFYSNIGFFYLNDNFEADIENNIHDNYCLCLSFCFMTNFDAGIRARGGAADQMVRISFERNRRLYYLRIIYDVSYFLICIIIMIDLVFGIILGTFSDMREKERKHDSDKINNCFICHINRETVEKRKEDFQFHRDKKHYLWNYVNYMIFLKFSEPHELNASNSFVRHNLDTKNICFFPSCLDNFDEGQVEEEEKEDEKVEESEESSSDSDSNYSQEESEEYDEDENLDVVTSLSNS